ncbi:hypothetical protein COV49_01330 [Candidatus Falkowbacteria bacterium CG11_big_fil_rev_8_21_14_0_20_39_10]|uniref:Acyl carrier protein n=1 Tax=Candidatus Falkowbacteria bacterium CG11_big_fil_rev_8_21_14_0_20_39_10 TaxID=1974570 RepID=A0A2M6K9T3_9BACT|nr:MAG: hypothetical protein COV49_01330 [Candidatus Falkowbacteria bacterium CG11_big_fil_rev_8_21_14_0_20_39_10]
MKKEEIKKKVRDVFIEIFPEIKKVKFDFYKKQSEFENWDSFNHMMLVSKAEEEFRIKLKLEDIINIDSPAGFVSLVVKKLC